MALATSRTRSSPATSPWLRGGLVAIAALAVQVSVLGDLRVADAASDIMLGLAIAAGLVAGRERGVVAAFALGILYDLVLTTPFGLSALAYTLTALAVTRLTERMLHPLWWFTMGVGLAGSALGVLIYALVGSVFGLTDVFNPRLIAIIAVVAIVNAVVMPVLLRVARWALLADRR